MIPRPFRHLCSLLCLLAAAPDAAAQGDSLAPVRSLGQPAQWKPYAGAFLGVNHLADGTDLGGLAVLGAYRDLVAPLAGIGVAGEAYAGTLGDGVDGGVRVGLSVPAFFFHAGLDYAFGLGELDLLLGLSAPLRRGGIVGGGSRLRVDWLPGRRQTLNVGITIPIRQGPMGATRPPSHKVATPRAARPAAAPLAEADAARARALAEMDRSQQWLVTAFSLLEREKGKTHAAALEAQRARLASFLDSVAVTDPLRPNGRAYEHELAVWHDRMAVAFGLATGAPEARAAELGAPLAARARVALLDSLVLPYDALFGQHRDPDHVWGYAARARAAFEAALPALDDAARGRVLGTFDRVVAMLEAQRAARQGLEKDSRYGWIPLQLALLPEEYDGQAELNRLLGRLAQRPLVPGNRLAYVTGAQFHATLLRQIASARRYHVLWIHDFPGLNAAGGPDTVAFRTVRAYLHALAAAARAYDTRGSLPRFFLLLDQNYYDARRSRLWMDVLEAPLTRRIALPPGHEGMAAALAEDQAALRAAVAGSRRLQEAARTRGGDGWLAKLLKVNVSITHPADPSFVSRYMVLDAPFVPDNIARDHRKMSFMDLSADAPGEGSAILTGVGVAENYADATWDDRALVVDGPAAAVLPAEVHRLLRRNGFAPADIPAFFPDEAAKPAAQPVDALLTGVVVVTNDVGFGRKAASAVEMGLLTLMPAGSLIYIPDSIWTSMIYASELVVAALRGCHVRVIAPARSNAPSQAGPTMARTWDVFTRLLEVELGLRATLATRRGDLRVGFYQRRARLDDVPALLREVADGLERIPWLVEEMDLAGASAGMRRLADSVARRPLPLGTVVGDTLSRAPRLHAKMQLFMTGPAWRGLLGERRLRPLVSAEVLPTFGLQLPMDSAGVPQGSDELMALAARAAAGLPTGTNGDAGAAMFLTVGSLNKDLRGMLLDGEVNAVVAGPKALLGLLEFVHVLGLSRFPETQEELNALMPPSSEKVRGLAYRLRRAL